MLYMVYIVIWNTIIHILIEYYIIKIIILIYNVITLNI